MPWSPHDVAKSAARMPGGPHDAFASDPMGALAAFELDFRLGEPVGALAAFDSAGGASDPVGALAAFGSVSPVLASRGC